MLEIVPGTSLTYQWKGCGLKLKVPTNALDSNVPSRMLRLHTCTTDQFKIPEDMELVSGIYWVDFVGEFANPITIELEHCACLGQPSPFSSLSFISTEGPAQVVSYKLQPLSGGIFPQNSSYGSIQLSHSSAMAVATLGSASKSYRILKYYTHQNTTTWLMHLIIVCDLQIYIKVSYFSLKPIIPCIG